MRIILSIPDQFCKNTFDYNNTRHHQPWVSTLKYTHATVTSNLEYMWGDRDLSQIGGVKAGADVQVVFGAGVMAFRCL